MTLKALTVEVAVFLISVLRNIPMIIVDTCSNTNTVIGRLMVKLHDTVTDKLMQ